MSDHEYGRRTRRTLGAAAGAAMLSIGAVFVAMHHIPAPAAATIVPPTCVGPLTGRILTVPAGQMGFGAVQHQPPLPFEPGEYAITIDDGPDADTTPRLLAILRARCIRATFFMIGRKAERDPAVVRAVVAQGHGVGSHSYTHGNFSTMTPAEMQADILRGADAVERAAYGRPRPAGGRRLFRIPGAIGVPQEPPPAWMRFLADQRLTLAGYDFSPQDWRNSPPAVSFARLFPHIRDRGVIVIHDGQPNTIALLPMVLDELQRRRARIVSLSLGVKEH